MIRVKVRVGFCNKFSKLASASRTWQVGELAAALPIKSFIPHGAANAGGGLTRKAGGLLAVAAAGGHPLAPFVVSEKTGGDGEDSEDAEEDLHGVFRIA